MERMLPLIIEADPTLEAAWLEGADEPAPLHYMALGSMARHLVAQLERGETGRFLAVFEVVERWHVEGDRDVRQAATIGLLEDLQNENLHKQTRPADFEPWLRPESRRFWDKLNRFWLHGEIITDD